MTGAPTTSPGLCDACGEEQVVPILWGMPRPDDLDRTDVVFGGCVVSETDADAQCRSCGRRYRRGATWTSDPQEG